MQGFGSRKGKRFVKRKGVKGYLGEDPACAEVNSGIFDAWKERGDVMAAVFGHDHMNEFAGDVDGIYKKMTDDLSLYQEEADKRGMSPEAVRTMHRLEEEARQAKAQAQIATEEAQLRNHFQSLSNQAEQLKQTFPSFDLMQEMANPQFVRMTSPQVGLSVKDAFYAIHGEEIQRQTMQYTAQQAGQRIAASVQAGASRPAENGQRRQGPVNVAVDIAHMDKKTRAQYMKRIRAGEEINFVDKF